MLVRNALFRYLPKVSLAFSTTPSRRVTSKVALYEQQGFLVLPNAVKPEEAEALRNAGSLILRTVIEQPEGPIMGLTYGQRREVKDEYMMFTGGKQVLAHIKEMKLTENLKGFAAPGMKAISGALHDILKPFYQFTYSEQMKRIVKNLLKMDAPLVANTTYLFSMHKDWNILHKDNSLIRTYPLSTQTIVAVLSDLAPDEGFFYAKDSHKSPPTTFLRKVYEPEPGKDRDFYVPQKCIMIPKVKEESCCGERVELKKGDILVYDGDLSYCLNCYKEDNHLLFIRLIEGRGTKWENDNLCNAPAQMMYKAEPLEESS